MNNGSCKVDNTVDAISSRVAGVTALTDQLDEDFFPNEEVMGIMSFEQMLKSPSPSLQDWDLSLELETSVDCGENGGHDRSNEEEFWTVSECTCTPESTSSSYYTAAEFEHSYSKPSWPNEERNEVVEVVKTQRLRFSREGCTIDTETTAKSISQASSAADEMKMLATLQEETSDNEEVGHRKRFRAV